jgi:hypothetical protein
MVFLDSSRLRSAYVYLSLSLCKCGELFSSKQPQNLYDVYLMLYVES